jgi:SAM-dependent methyltransferase
MHIYYWRAAARVKGAVRRNDGEPAQELNMSTMHTMETERIRDVIRRGYARIAEGSRKGCGCGPACGPRGDGVAEAIGYAEDEVGSLPEGADLGLSCGNPTALAALGPGETVLDLGSGGGLDCFIAGPKVGAGGRVIGVDMTAEMVARARNNIAEYRLRSGLDNVEFRLGEIEHLPVADASVDVVISNCVINLSPEKAQVWKEIARVLKPGGRVAVSDLALLRPLPEGARKSVEALVGCIAGAALVEDTRRMMEAAGLVNIEMTPRPGYMQAMKQIQDPLYQELATALPPGSAPADFVTSLDIAARKAG